MERRAGELNDLKGLMAGCAWEKQPYVSAGESYSVLEDERELLDIHLTISSSLLTQGQQENALPNAILTVFDRLFQSWRHTPARADA